jgi:hypothetical protein
VTFFSAGYMAFALQANTEWLVDYVSYQCWRLDSELMAIKILLDSQTSHTISYKVTISCINSGRRLHSFLQIVVAKSRQNSLPRVLNLVYMSGDADKPNGGLLTLKEFKRS